MVALDKVLKGLECCGDINKTKCHLCPYDYNGRSDRHECTSDMATDALDLLKERIKTPVIFKKNGEGYLDPECGYCGQYLDKAYSFCPKCKKELDWNV